MKSHSIAKGYTLVEVMITVAIIAISASIAIPAYDGYIQTTKNLALRANADPLRLALDDHFLDNGTYVAGTWFPAGAQTLQTGVLGWRPDGDGNGYNYTVVAPPAPDTIATGYSITVTKTDDATATLTCTRSQANGFVCP